jgi:hypothetical protein
VLNGFSKAFNLLLSPPISQISKRRPSLATVPDASVKMSWENFGHRESEESWALNHDRTMHTELFTPSMLARRRRRRRSRRRAAACSRKTTCVCSAPALIQLRARWWALFGNRAAGKQTRWRGPQPQCPLGAARLCGSVPRSVGGVLSFGPPDGPRTSGS